VQSSSQFNIEAHRFASSILHTVVNDAVEFFASTQPYNLPPPQRFLGPGIYALYYIGTTGIYGELGKKNVGELKYPIYVGQASPKGVRQARVEDTDVLQPRLWSRLQEHRRSIDQVDNLNLSDFRCRFVLMVGEEIGLIRTVESALILRYRPLWNTYIDGFGIHDPGAGRARQLQSEWDSIHPGRGFTAKMESSTQSVEPIIDKIQSAIDLLD
jgi:hypothetical protein